MYRGLGFMNKHKQTVNSLYEVAQRFRVRLCSRKVFVCCIASKLSTLLSALCLCSLSYLSPISCTATE